MKEFGLVRGERCERNSHDRKSAIDEYRELIDKNTKLKQENNDLDTIGSDFLNFVVEILRGQKVRNPLINKEKPST